MHKIIKKRQIAPGGYLFKVHAPHIVNNAEPGNFIVIRLNEKGERIPLTLVRWSKNSGTVDFAFQVVGKTTHQLSQKQEGDYIKDILGPLGHPSKIQDYGTVALLAGGFGAAALLPIAKSLKRRGNKIITVLGARSKNYLVFKNELKRQSHNLIITTDDGSEGIKGFVMDGLKRAFGREGINHAFIVGPAIMMKFTSHACRELGIPATASLNPIMVDGTGMCGSCRVKVGDKTYFTCVDGPEFDASKVDWDLLLARLETYREEEITSYKLSLEKGE